MGNCRYAFILANFLTSQPHKNFVKLKMGKKPSVFRSPHLLTTIKV